MSKDTTHRRSKFKVIFGDFQIRFILAVLSLSLFVSAFLGFELYQLELEKSQILQIQDESIHQLVRQFDQGLLLFVVMIIVLQAIALIFLIVHLTQRVAGPIYRIQKELETAIANNEPAEMNPVRKNDEFQEFFTLLKVYIDRFKNHP